LFGLISTALFGDVTSTLNVCGPEVSDAVGKGTDAVAFTAREPDHGMLLVNA